MKGKLQTYMSVSAKYFLDNVKTGDTLMVERATRDNLSGDAPEWSDYGPIHSIKVHVQRRTKSYKDRGVFHPAGELAILTIQNGGWADYSLEDFDGDTFVCENYYMRVHSWNGETIVS